MKKNYVKATLQVYKVEPCVPLAASPEVSASSEGLGEDSEFDWATTPTQQSVSANQDAKAVEFDF